MATTKSDILKSDKILNSGLIKLYDPTLGQYVRAAAFRDLIIETEVFEKESLATDDCFFGEIVTRQDATASFNLIATRSPWILRHLFGFTQESIVVGATISITDEEILVDDLAGDGIYSALLSHIDWSHDVVQNIIVEDDQNNILTLGTDYTVEVVNGYTAIQMVAGGAIAKGDTLLVSYDYDPLVDLTFSSGKAQLHDAKQFVFVGAVESGITADQQDKYIEITFPAADVISSLKFQWLDCKGEKDEIEMPVQIRNRKGTDWFVKFISR